MKLLLFTAIAITASLAHAQNYGKYVGTVQAEWLEDGRRMRLLAPLSYFDPNGQEWRAPIGWVVNGASIPQLAWSVIGGPFEGKYRNASVIHDVGCDQKTEPWEAVHEVFYWAMLASGVEIWRAKVMYAAVYHFGPRWPRLVTVKGLPEKETLEALQKALKQADPGSTAKIVEIHPYGPGFPPGQKTASTDKADFDIRVMPPPMRLTERDFEELKQRIVKGEEPRDPRAGPSVVPRKFTLDAIRAFQPGSSSYEFQPGSSNDVMSPIKE